MIREMGIWIVACFITCCSITVGADTYEYDILNRLTKVIYEDGSYVEYEYDANGNLIRTNVYDATPQESETGTEEPSGSMEESTESTETGESSTEGSGEETESTEESTESTETGESNTEESSESIEESTESTESGGESGAENIITQIVSAIEDFFTGIIDWIADLFNGETKR